MPGLNMLPVECLKCHAAFAITVPADFTLTVGVPELKVLDTFKDTPCPHCGHYEENLFDFCDAKIHDMVPMPDMGEQSVQQERFREEDILHDYKILSKMFGSILACPKLLPDGTENDDEENMIRFAQLPESDNEGNVLYYKADDTAW